MLKYLSFHNSSFSLIYIFNVNGKAIVWHTPCLKIGFASMDFEGWKGRGGKRRFCMECGSPVLQFHPEYVSRLFSADKTRLKLFTKTPSARSCNAGLRRSRAEEKARQSRRKQGEKGGLWSAKRSIASFAELRKQTGEFLDFLFELILKFTLVLFFYALDIIPVSRRNG